MDEIVRFQVANKTFTGSVLVAKGDQVVFNRSYGLANVEWNIPNTTTTKFRLGSITKQFTAAAILLLEEQGKLKLEDPVKTHWPEAPAAWDKVTLFHLLTHTSGMPPPDNEAWRLTGGPTEKAVGLFRDKPLEFEPGSQHNYSNSAYILLGYLIERVSGQPYSEFLQEKIFRPLGMSNSGMDSDTEIILNRAAGYSSISDPVVNAAYINMTSSIGSGSLYSTTEDLLRWNRGLFGGKVLSPASLKKMTTPFKDNYALGLDITKEKDRNIIRHGGSIQGFNAGLAYWPDDQITVVVLANHEGDSSTAIARQLDAVMHGEPVVLPSERKEIQLTEGDLKKFAGIYEFNPDTNLVITTENGQLSGRLGTQGARKLFAESANRFFLRDLDGQLEFEQDAAGAVTGLVLHQDGNQNRARRLAERSEVKLSAEVLLRHAGTYSIAPNVDVVMSVEDGHLMAKPPSDPKQELFAESETKFFFKTFSGEVEFTTNKNGRTTGLIFTNGGEQTRAAKR
jgi:CubicO group peptidase (beta-lactamase class C family)